MSEAFLTVVNSHAESCGIPPTFKSGEGYLSYFEGVHGDQWVFAMDRASGVFFVCGGDVGWESRRIGEEGLKSLVLSKPEQFWVLACLSACGLSEVAERVAETWPGL
jgi:hypothetical protein